MDDKLRGAVAALVDYVFADNDPTPEKLEEHRRTLPGEYWNLVSLFLNTRLMLRWRGFGVAHANIRLIGDAGPGERARLELRMYDPLGQLDIVKFGLRRAGFDDIRYLDESGGMGGNLRATATLELVQRLQGS